MAFDDENETAVSKKFGSTSTPVETQGKNRQGNYFTGENAMSGMLKTYKLLYWHFTLIT